MTDPVGDWRDGGTTMVGGLGVLLVMARLFAEPVGGPNQPERVDAPISVVRAPVALNDKAAAQFVIEGEFPNDCYAVGRVVVRSRTEDLEMGAIQFHLEALKYKRDNCSPNKVAFSKTVELGVLPAGQYQIVSIKDQKARGILNIAKAESKI